MALDVRRLAHWALGAPVEAWRYATRTVPIYRSEVAAPRDEPLLEARADPGKDVQPAASGTGPEFNRTYEAFIVGGQGDAEAVLATLAEDFGEACPDGMTEVAEPADGPLEPGDEVQIRLAGPWDAPVRVIAAEPTRFRFATLDGHMEAGEIEFRTADGPDGGVTFTIESWARSATRAFAALYHPLGIGKEVQLHMWATVIERVAERSGGSIDDGIRVITRRREVGRG